MKGIMGSVRGQLVSAKSNYDARKSLLDTEEVNARLSKELPEYDLRVFSGIRTEIGKYIGEPRVTFVERVRVALLGVARTMYPDCVYLHHTNMTILYEAVKDFIDNRDAKIKAYKQNKK